MCCYFVFFFKQKTAYEIASCLVGSEMCIRDSPGFDQLVTSRFGIPEPPYHADQVEPAPDLLIVPGIGFRWQTISVLALACLLYTSDAADDTPCVDLGGRRIIKKKNK
ncbi:5-formyltetrahydrofolate cyclo-ligase [Lactobacillus rhamnosus GG] [Lacticaseibacillus rhamnosus]|nr:5-formyltetrahydrofolate cyclo-ligase [Lactobacillus rhamnosus GG] [Lacticaseibacillus rhamnosus]